MSETRKWFTADAHFGSSDILSREMRPFRDAAEYTREQVGIWNGQAGQDDLIYAIGDFFNCSYLESDEQAALAASGQIKARIVLITGNSEERLIRDRFGGEFERFREYCLEHGRFEDVKRNDYTEIGGRRFFLTHRPSDHARECLTLFGHTHRAGGLWRPYGFNVGVDLNHFRLFSEQDILGLLDQKLRWYDSDPDINCFD